MTAPSLYDLLDVDPDATTDEIRAAWKVAIADLDPTDRRFRAYNSAAATLLDADRRAEYDASLAPEVGEAGDADVDAGSADATDAGAADETAGVEPDDADAATVAATHDEADEDSEVDEFVLDEGDADVEDAEDEAADESDRADDREAAGDVPSGPPTWALGLGVFLAVLSAALLIVVLTWPGSRGGESPRDREEQAAAASSSVEDAAADIVPQVLSYDYRTYDADLEEALPHLTEDFGAKRAALLQDLRDQVIAEKASVVSVVSGTGVTRVSDNGRRAQVVVFIDQDSQRGKKAATLKMWATLTLVLDGDEWLLDDICIETECS